MLHATGRSRTFQTIVGVRGFVEQQDRGVDEFGPGEGEQAPGEDNEQHTGHDRAPEIVGCTLGNLIDVEPYEAPQRQPLDRADPRRNPRPPALRRPAARRGPGAWGVGRLERRGGSHAGQRNQAGRELSQPPSR